MVWRGAVLDLVLAASGRDRIPEQRDHHVPELDGEPELGLGVRLLELGPVGFKLAELGPAVAALSFRARLSGERFDDANLARSGPVWLAKTCCSICDG